MPLNDITDVDVWDPLSGGSLLLSVSDALMFTDATTFVVAQVAPGVPTIWSAPWWDGVAALGTLAAVALAALVAVVEATRARKAIRERNELISQQREDERRKVAALVSAWVESTYEPSHDGSHYDQRAHVFIANESDEPVFEVNVTVGAGEPPVQIGPLAVPVPIPVLPSRRTRSWDISMGLFAHSHSEGLIPVHPVARIDFTDARGARWHRSFDGRLRESAEVESTLLEYDETLGEKQLGDLTNLFNPMVIAILFRSALTESPLQFDVAKQLLDENAEGWKSFDKSMAEDFRADLSDYGLAAHVWYPAPYVAYVRFVHDEDAKKTASRAGYLNVRARVLTLTFVPERGWRIFSLGPTMPDWIGFPPSTVDRAPRDSVRRPKRRLW